MRPIRSARHLHSGSDRSNSRRSRLYDASDVELYVSLSVIMRMQRAAGERRHDPGAFLHPARRCHFHVSHNGDAPGCPALQRAAEGISAIPQVLEPRPLTQTKGMRYTLHNPDSSPCVCLAVPIPLVTHDPPHLRSFSPHPSVQASSRPDPVQALAIWHFRARHVLDELQIRGEDMVHLRAR